MPAPLHRSFPALRWDDRPAHYGYPRLSYDGRHADEPTGASDDEDDDAEVAAGMAALRAFYERRYEPHMSHLTEAKAARSRMQAMPAEGIQILAAYRAARLQAAQSWDPSQRRKLLAQLKSDFDAKVAELTAEHTRQAETFHAATRKVRRAPVNLGTTEALAWERLRGHLEAAARQKPGTSLTLVAGQRLDRAKADGDEPMLRAARAMLPDYLADRPGEAPEEVTTWLDVTSGEPGVLEAAALEEEGRRGIAWTRQALDWVAAEIAGTLSLGGASIVPTWEGGAMEFGLPPDVDQAARATDAASAEILAGAGYRPVGRGGIAKTGGRRTSEGANDGAPEGPAE